MDGLNLLRDLRTVAPRSMTLLVVLVLAGAAGTAGAAALAGPVLVDRSWPAFVALTVAMLLAVGAQVWSGLVAARVTADWAADLRRRLCLRALGQDLVRLEATPVGELLDRIDGDCHQVGAELRTQGLQLARSLTLAAFSVLTAFVVWWPVGLGMVAVVVLLVVGLRRRVAAIRPARVLEEEAWSDLAAVTEEAVHGQDDVRTTLGRSYVLRLYAQRAAVVLDRGRTVWRLGADVTTTAFGFTVLAVIALVVAGAWALSAGVVDATRLTSLWLLAVGFGLMAEQVSRMVPELQYALGAWERIRSLAATPQEPAGGRSPVAGDLRVVGLTFGYADEGPHGRGPALRDVSVTFRRGRSCALVGRTGSGKTTLTKVLSRAVEIPRGVVFLGDTDVVDLDLEQWRRWVGVVPQRTDILGGTLRENIALFDRQLYPAVDAATAELGLQDWLEELPAGLDTPLGAGGVVLSAGQEQLVAFARIMVRRPQVVILDEATARLDPLTERRVQQATARLLRGRIGILVAHRPSSVSRCDDVLVLADGRVTESGPLASSGRFAHLVAAAGTAPAADGLAPAGPLAPDDPPRPLSRPAGPAAEPPAPLRTTLREILQLVRNDPRYGLAVAGLWVGVSVLGLNGALLPVLWARLVDGQGGLLWPTLGIVAALLAVAPVPWFVGRWFPEWWVRQVLRISLRLVDGQLGPRRRSRHTPAEVVAHGGDTERVVRLADHLIDLGTVVVVAVATAVLSGSVVPAAFLLGTVLLSGAAATAFGARLGAASRRTVAARAAFATALVSALSAARTVKLAGATAAVLHHLDRLERERSRWQRREVVTQVWARSVPWVVSGSLPIVAWWLYLTGHLSAGATLVTVAAMAASAWFAWTAASLVAQLPSARVWTARTLAMAGGRSYSAELPDVDLTAGTAPPPEPVTRRPLTRLELVGFGAVHDDGTVAVRDVAVTVQRGEFVLLVGPVGAGKSSLLRALAGIVRHTGELRWNGEPVTEPELFLRPDQVGYVGQLPRVLSGTVADNILLGHDLDPGDALSAAQLDGDLRGPGGGLGLLIGHKGTRLSGGQLQRLALARALARRTELLIADDVSSALDVDTELAVWAALRGRGVTVVGATAKRAALRLADQVLVLVQGRCVDQGPWHRLEPRWGGLAG